jgi:hypothetical protein
MAERLPRARPKSDLIAEALTFDRAVKSDGAPAAHARAEAGQLSPDDWDTRFASFLERVMATAAIGGDPKPLQRELEALLNEAPPGKKEELEKNRGKPPTAPPSKTPTEG